MENLPHAGKNILLGNMAHNHIDATYLQIMQISPNSGIITCMELKRVRVGPQGRIVIPAAVREAMGLGVGEELILRVEDRRLVLERREDAARRLKERFSKVPPGKSLSKELIAERREEAKRENRA